MKLQITLFDPTRKHRPISTIVEIKDMDYYMEHKKEVQQRAIANICHQRYTTWSYLKMQGYTQVKVREYDLEKIALQQRVKQLEHIHAKRLTQKECQV